MARKGSHQRPTTRRGADSEREFSPVLQAALLEVVDTQLRDGTPPETRATLDRLVAPGYPEPQAHRLIGCVAATEVFDVLQRKEPYDEVGYVAALRLVAPTHRPTWIDHRYR